MAQGRKTGGRQAGTKNKATVAREQAQASSIAQATAAVLSGINLSAFDGITGLAVMRMAMAAHLHAGDLDKAAIWGEKVAPYETPKPLGRPIDTDVDQGGVLIRGGLPDADPHHPPHLPPGPGPDLE